MRWWEEGDEWSVKCVMNCCSFIFIALKFFDGSHFFKPVEVGSPLSVFQNPNLERMGREWRNIVFPLSPNIMFRLSFEYEFGEYNIIVF